VIFSGRAQPRAAWAREGDGYAMTTARLDVAGVLAAGGGAARALPPETRIGHVHLRAAGLAAAGRLYVEGLGMAVTRRRPAAAWFGAGAYHHHLAVNAWAGPLPPRRPGQPGLEGLTLAPRDAATRARLAAALEAAGWRDPAGVALSLA
jgi:catechol 2,3-dioxygenase